MVPCKGTSLDGKIEDVLNREFRLQVHFCITFNNLKFLSAFFRTGAHTKLLGDCHHSKGLIVQASVQFFVHF